MKRLIAIAVALAIMLTGVVSTTSNAQASAPGDVVLPGTPPLVVHSRVVVNGPSDFVGQGFTGSGSSFDPYVLENVVIDAAGAGSGIFIGDTSSTYFEIRNSIIVNAAGTPSNPLASGAGIVLFHAEKGTIFNCNISGNDVGIAIFAGGDIEVRQCSLYNNGIGVQILPDAGAPFTNPVGIDLYRNYFSGTLDGGYAIYASSASYLDIDGNKFRVSSPSDAIHLIDCTSHNVVEDNDLAGYPGNGVVLIGGDNTAVHNNNLLNTVGTPITVIEDTLNPSPIHNLVVSNNNCSGASTYGLFIDAGTTPLIGASIVGNTLNGHFVGIYVSLNPSSYSNTIERNICLDNNYAGIELYDFQMGVIRYNTCHNSYDAMGGLGLVLSASAPLPSSGTTNNIISNNDLSQNRYPLRVGTNNDWNTIENNDCSYGVINIQIESSDNSISYNTIYNSEPRPSRNPYGALAAIFLSGTASDNSIMGNIISIPDDIAWGSGESSTPNGILLDGDPLTKPSGNNIAYNQVLFCSGSGIKIIDATLTNVEGNTVMGMGNGIEMFQTSLGTVRLNSIYPYVDAMSNGIVLGTTTDSEVSRNLITGLSGDAVVLGSSSNGNFIINNWLSNNALYGVWVGSSNSNFIYLNAFDSNNGGGKQAYSTEDLGANSWSNGGTPDQGNYWSDHTNIDADLDGYADSPYSIAGPGSEVDPAPLTFVVGPVRGLAYTNGYETVHLTWSDPAYSTYYPATEILVYRDGGLVPFAILPATAENFIDTTVAANEVHTYKVSASLLGMENPLSPSVTVVTPIAPVPNPMAFSIDPVAPVQTSSSVIVSWTATDDPTTVYHLSLDNFMTEVSTSATTYTFTGLADSPYGQPYTLYIKAINSLNEFEARSVQFAVDTAAPIVISNLGFENTFGSGHVPFYCYVWEDTGAGIANVTVYLDGVLLWDDLQANVNYAEYGLPTPIDLGGTTPLAGGTHTLVICSADAAGHLTTATYQFIVDDVAPILAITSDVLTNGFTNLPEPSFMWQFSNDPAVPAQQLTYMVKIDSGEWVSVGTGTKFTAPTLQDGAHIFWLKGIDMGGHETIGSLSFVLDSVGPIITALSPPTGSLLIDGVVNLAWTATDGDGVGLAEHWYKLDGQVGQFVLSSAASQTATLTGVTTGSHVLKVWAIDAAGNWGPVMRIAFIMDGDPPLTTAVITGTVGTNGWYTSAVSVDLVATDIGSGVAATYYRFGTSGAWLTYTTALPVNAEGATTLEFYSVDNYGSVEATKTVTIHIDTVAPVTSIAVQGTPGSLAGWYKSAVSVNLTATDATSQVYVTQYDLDGAGWATYAGNFTVSDDGAHTVLYRSIDMAGNVEVSGSLSFTIDTTGPVTVASYTGATGLNGWNTSAVTVTLTASDPTSGVAYIMYRLNGGTWTQYVDAILLSGEGVNVIEFNATNNNGIVEATQSLTFHIDTVAPVTTAHLIGQGGLGGWYSSPVVINLTAFDATSTVGRIQYNLDGAGWTIYHGDLTIIATGAHTLDFRAEDKAGNLEAIQTVMFSLDYVAPVSTYGISGGTGLNGWNNTTVTVTLSATDDASGVAGISYRINGGSWTAYSAPIVINEEWIVVVEFFATDNAGNVESVKSLTIKIDRSAPVTSAGLAGTIGSAGWYRSIVTATLLAADPFSGVNATWYRLDGIGEFALYTGAIVVTGEGAHMLEYYSVDNAGNVEAVKNVTFNIDTVAPVTVPEISGGVGDNGWNNTDVTVVLNATDATSGVSYVAYRINGGDWTIYSVPLLLTADMSYVIEFRAVDVAGNTEFTGMVSLKIDKTAPTTGIELAGTAGSAGWYRSSVTATLSPADATSGVASTWYRIDGVGNFMLYTGAFDIMGEGSHSVEYYSIDNAGNMEVTTTALFGVDTVAPSSSVQVTGTTGLNGWNTSVVTVTLTASDATSGVAQVRYRVNGGDWNAYTTPITLSADGLYHIEFYAEDVAGNAEEIGSLDLKVDQTAPVTSPHIDGASGMAGWNTSVVSVALVPFDATSGVLATYYRIDGAGDFVEYTGAIGLETDGIYLLEYYTVDMAGNEEPLKQTTVKVDATAPLLSLNAPPEGSYHNSALVAITWTGSDAESGLGRYSLRLDGGAWINIDVSLNQYILDLIDGYHTVDVKAQDVAGNSVSRTVNFTVDTVPPEVISYGPQGAMVLRNATMEVEFSEIMDQSTVVITVNGVAGTIVKTETGAVFTPSRLLEYNTTYEVTVTGKDLAGNSVLFSWSFATKAGIGTITGILINEDGHPITNAEVSLAFGPSTTTDSNGRYWLNATQGYYTMHISAPEMVNITMGVFVVPDQTAEIGTIHMTEANEWMEHFQNWLILVIILVVGMSVLFFFLRKRWKA